ncbi:MAG: TetR/AcrR family transcriptional regulator [Desulfosarcina sp.]|nr:TetR/AcrR family transcriptional regulator [Desulfobacterales bacterium]
MVAAKKVFSIKGFTKTTMEDIAREAELSPGTLYLYFKNKDELYASLSVEILEHLYNKLKRVYIMESQSPQRRIDHLKQTLLEVYEFDPLILVNLFHLQSSDILKNLSAPMLSHIRDFSRKTIDIISKIFEEGISGRVFIEKNPKDLSDVMWALFSGIVLWEESKRIINDQQEPTNPDFDTAFEIFSRGISR